MLDHLFWIAIGVFLIAAALFIKIAVKKGWSWAAAKLKSWWNAGKADLASLGSRVTALESDVAALKGAPAAAPAAPTAVHQ